LTEKTAKETSSAVFFKEVLTPLASEVRRAGKSFFPLQADAPLKSYYLEPRRPVMDPGDFELRAAESLQDFINELVALWTSEGNGELAALAPGLAELAREIAAQDQKEEEVSDFIYVMF
jgi:hypothetical protein